VADLYEGDVAVLLYRQFVPVAYSMVDLVRGISQVDSHPYQSFMCYWTAFNNIYTTVYDQRGHKPRHLTNNPREIQTHQGATIRMPRVWTPSERDEIASARAQFSDNLKHELITHESTAFFVYRTPHWKGRPIERDEQAHPLNGVIDVGHTLTSTHPVWAPIDIHSYLRYVRDADSDDRLRDHLTEQIVEIIYIVRNNLFHGGKMAHDENDVQVVENVIPLLSMIVSSFLHLHDEDVPA
jgi:hypothetical protein